MPMLQTDVQPNKHKVLDTLKEAGTPLTLDADSARALGLASQVVQSDQELYASYGLEGRPKGARATWVDNLVTTLNDPWMSGLLLFIGLFMLILELKLPGVGLPAIISALAFLLFFWSHYLGGSANGLEIMLFLVGVVCLLLELFVFPGFAVFGLSGILLILVSVIMASHTFIWPSKDYEFRQMGGTLMEVTGAIVMVTVGAVVVGRYFPSLPLFRRMVLHPVPAGMEFDEVTGKPIANSDGTYFHLLGEVGHCTTALKPTGKARFGESLIDVTADGFYIEPGTPVEVVEVQGSKVIVKRV
jgi:membrane-bound serine protease (ClpP class)